MALRNLLVHMGDDDRAGDRLSAACGLARQHDATVTGIYVRPYPVVVPAAPMGGAVPVVEGLIEAYAEACRRAKQRFEEVTAHEGVRTAWHEDDGDAAERISFHARYADLAVVQQWSPDDTPDRLPRDMAAIVAIGSGRPALVLPYAGKPALTCSKVMLCWNESRESARAAHDMLAMVKHDARVDVVCVDPEEAAERDPGADIAGHLAAHGLTVDVHRLSSGDLSVADTILSASTDLGSDLIVMGAYGHSRMREVVFGGVTRDILARMTVPVVLSH